MSGLDFSDLALTKANGVRKGFDGAHDADTPNILGGG